MLDSMQMMRAIDWYDANAEERSCVYSAMDPVRINGWWSELKPPAPALAVDIGAGSGRDAGWLAEMGHPVIAVEPSPGMRRQALLRGHSPQITWLDDQLPELQQMQARQIKAQLVLVSAVWMHLPHSQRPAAMHALVSIMAPGSLLVMTVRQGPAEAERLMYRIDANEVADLGTMAGLQIARRIRTEDQMQRQAIAWDCLAFRKH